MRNLDDELIAKLEVLAGEPRGSFKEVAAKLRAMTAGRRHTPAEKLLREGRDQR